VVFYWGQTTDGPQSDEGYKTCIISDGLSTKNIKTFWGYNHVETLYSNNKWHLCHQQI
jgi:hypothetical protein